MTEACMWRTSSRKVGMNEVPSDREKTVTKSNTAIKRILGTAIASRYDDVDVVRGALASRLAKPSGSWIFERATSAAAEQAAAKKKPARMPKSATNPPEMSGDIVSATDGPTVKTNANARIR